MYGLELYQQDLEYIGTRELDYRQLEHKKILITGGNGLVASCLIDALMWMNAHRNLQIGVYALCRNEKRARKRFQAHLESPYFHIVVQDIQQPLQMDMDVDYMIHAASNAHPKSFTEDPVGTMKSNLTGTMELLEYGRLHGLSRFVLISTGEIYGTGEEGQGDFTEETFGRVQTMQARSCYPESKRAAETLCAAYAQQYHMDAVVVRLCYVYGPAITDTNSRADAQFLRNVLDGQDIVMKSKGEQVRSYCYVADAAAAILTVLLNGNNTQAYNVSNEQSNCSIWDYAHVLAAEGGVKVCYQPPSEIEQQGYSKVPRAVLSNDKLKSLGWSPNYNLEQGLERTVQIARQMKTNLREICK